MVEEILVNDQALFNKDMLLKSFDGKKWFASEETLSVIQTKLLIIR